MTSSGKQGSGHRSLHVRVKSARNRKPSSTRWLQRQLNDPYVQRARQEGYRSRAAYKLVEMDDNFKLLTPNSIIVDLGAAPGGWMQVAAHRALHSTIIGLDLLPIEPITGTTTLLCDFTTEEGYHLLDAALIGKKVDLVLSDMAPSTCGHAATDHLRIMAMCEIAFDFARHHLKEGGSFVAKVFKGGTERELLTEMKRCFATVKHTKPDSSRKESSEMYVVAQGFRNCSVENNSLR